MPRRARCGSGVANGAVRILFGDSAAFRSYRTLIALNRVKFGPALIVPEAN